MSERKKCPNCGGVQLRKIEDKSKPLSYAGHIPIYAKIYQCKSCGHKFE
ncbi:MAG: transposase [Promethearchaeota archaeon]